jgi:hypothetical protein
MKQGKEGVAYGDAFTNCYPLISINVPPNRFHYRACALSGGAPLPALLCREDALSSLFEVSENALMGDRDWIAGLAGTTDASDVGGGPSPVNEAALFQSHKRKVAVMLHQKRLKSRVGKVAKPNPNIAFRSAGETPGFDARPSLWEVQFTSVQMHGLLATLHDPSGIGVDVKRCLATRGP